MANRNNMYSGSGGSVPSGSAPLFLGDLATPTAALGQKMTERLIKQNEADKTRRGKERTALLNAMDFSAVEGLGYKVNQEHLDNINKFGEKYQERWLSQGKKLSDNDYLEMQRDKLTLKQDIANKKHNVAQIAYIQNQLKTNPYGWESGSVDRLAKFIEDGNAGADASQILIPQFDVLGELQGRIKSAEFGKEKTINYRDGVKDVISSNKKSVDSTVDNFVVNNPKIQQLLKSPDPSVRARAEADINSYKEFHTRQDIFEEPLSATEAKQQMEANLTPAQQTIDANFDWTGKGMERKHFQNMAELNNTITRIVNKERDALNEIDYVKGFGKVNRVLVNNEGDLVLNGGTNKSPKTRVIEMPDENTSEAVAKKMMVDLVEIIKPGAMVSGNIPKNYTDFLELGWKVDLGDIAGNTFYEDLKEEAVKESPSVDKLMDSLKYLFEDEKVKELSSGLTRWYSGVKFGGVKYNVKNPQDMKDLVTTVEKKKGMATEKPVQKEEPVIEKPVVKEAVGAFESYEEAVEAQVEAHKRPRAEVEEAMNVQGITPDKWEDEIAGKVTKTDSVSTKSTTAKKDSETSVAKSSVSKDKWSEVLDRKDKVKFEPREGGGTELIFPDGKTRMETVASPESVKKMFKSHDPKIVLAQIKEARTNRANKALKESGFDMDAATKKKTLKDPEFKMQGEVNDRSNVNWERPKSVSQDSVPSTKNKNIVGGVDMSDYATGPNHEKRIKQTYDSILSMTESGVSSYDNTVRGIQKKIDGHSNVKKAGNSPISAKDIVDLAIKYKVSPELLAATVQVDSSYGTDGTKAINTKNPGNVGNNDSGQLAYFPTWKAGLEAAAKYLSGDKKGALKGARIVLGKK